MLDLVIRNGLVVDGSGSAGIRADVGIDKGKITAIGRITESARDTLDADGHVVAPGFIDSHTHMDAQMHWDPLGSNSCWHGVTSVVMGNCGFTLAPSRSHQREFIVRNFERSEDIPGAAMMAGIKWDWETFPEYIDVIDRLPKGINYATNIGHSALRTWAMGEAGFEREANADEISRMKAQLREALRAGAIGLSTSRQHHATPDGSPVASRLASWDEVRQLVNTMAEMGAGIFQIAIEQVARVADPALRAEFFSRMRSLAVQSKVPFTFGIVPMGQTRGAWEDQLALLDSTAAAGGRMFGQCHSRGVTVLLSFRTALPFDRLPDWRPIRALPLEEQARLLRDPVVRQRLVQAAHHGDYGKSIGTEAFKPNYDHLRVFSGPYPPYLTVAEAARRRGVDPVELMIDLALESNFEQFFLQPAGGDEFSDADVLQIMKHPRTMMTFSDSGAHVSQIADSSIQTHLLGYWTRQRQVFTLEEAVHMMTQEPAQAWGFEGRGLLREGMVADIAVFDFERLAPSMPEVVFDLPTGARRLVQKSTGYLASIVGGQIMLREGRHTGALPGVLLRGPLARAAQGRAS